MDRIEREVEALQKRIWIRSLKESKTAIAIAFLVVAVLSWNIYRSSDKVVEHETLLGTLVGVHQTQRKASPSPVMLSIKLGNGEVITAVAPTHFVVRDRAEVEVIKSSTEQGSVYYHFYGYTSRKTQ